MPAEKDDGKPLQADFLKEIHEHTDDLDDDYLLGYAEAILNLAGEFTNGECEDCPFSHEVEVPAPDFIHPEYDLRCHLKTCWIDRIKKLISKEQEQQRKTRTLTDGLLEQAYDELCSILPKSHNWGGRVAMDDLFKHIRKNHISRLTLTQFKEFMTEFYEKYPLGDFSFERASGSRAEVKRYGFFISRRPAGIYYYIHRQVKPK